MILHESGGKLPWRSMIHGPDSAEVWSHRVLVLGLLFFLDLVL